MMTKCSKIRLQVSVLRTNGPMVIFQVLVYPSVNYTAHYPSQEEFQDDPVLSKDVRAWSVAFI